MAKCCLERRADDNGHFGGRQSHWTNLDLPNLTHVNELRRYRSYFRSSFAGGSIATGYKIALIASAVVLATALFATAAARQPSVLARSSTDRAEGSGRAGKVADNLAIACRVSAMPRDDITTG